MFVSSFGSFLSSTSEVPSLRAREARVTTTNSIFCTGKAADCVEALFMSSLQDRETLAATSRTLSSASNASVLLLFLFRDSSFSGSSVGAAPSPFRVASTASLRSMVVPHSFCSFRRCEAMRLVSGAFRNRLRRSCRVGRFWGSRGLSRVGDGW